MLAKGLKINYLIFNDYAGIMLFQILIIDDDYAENSGCSKR